MEQEARCHWAASCLSDPVCQNEQLKAWTLEAAKLDLHPSLGSLSLPSWAHSSFFICKLG